MNKKIKLLSLISTPILLGGGFAALTLVNQCSNKPEVRVYNLNDYINENISSYFSGGSMIPGADNVLDAAYALSKNGFRNLVSRDEFGENVEFTYFSYTLKNCTLVPIEGSTLFIGTVSLTWDVNGFNTSGTNWPGYNQDSDTTLDVTIENGVASISNATSYAATNLVIPDEVCDVDGTTYPLTIIEGDAFSANSSLHGSLTFGNNINSIGINSFSNCTSINSLNFGSSAITTIPDTAFSNCTGLTGSLNLPNNLIGIEKNAFSLCVNISSLSFPRSLEYIGDGAFTNCYNVTSHLGIPSNVTSIGSNAFVGLRNVSSVTILSSVRTIGSLAFNGVGHNVSSGITLRLDGFTETNNPVTGAGHDWFWATNQEGGYGCFDNFGYQDGALGINLLLLTDRGDIWTNPSDLSIFDLPDQYWEIG